MDIPDPIPSSDEVDTNQSNPSIPEFVPTSSTDETLNNGAQKDFIVYTRRPRQQAKVVEQVNTEAYSHEFVPDSTGNIQPKESSSYISPNESVDLNIPIAL